jgi:hypothetical protein
MITHVVVMLATCKLCTHVERRPRVARVRAAYIVTVTLTIKSSSGLIDLDADTYVYVAESVGL